MSLYHSTSEDTSLSPYSIWSCRRSKILSETTNGLSQEIAPMLNMSNETLFVRVHDSPLHKVEDMLPSLIGTFPLYNPAWDPFQLTKNMLL